LVKVILLVSQRNGLVGTARKRVKAEECISISNYILGGDNCIRVLATVADPVSIIQIS